MKSVDLKEIVLSKHKNNIKPTKIFNDLARKLSLSTIKRWCKSIKLFGSIKSTKIGRSKSSNHANLVKSVQKLISKLKSQRKVAQKLNTSKTMVQKILVNDLKLSPYKIRTEPKITPSHLEKRMKFCHWIRNNFSKEETLRFVFSDEKMFDIDGVYNSQNDRIWAVNREEADNLGGVRQLNKFPQKVMVWLAICSKGVSPVYIFDKGPVNGQVYIEKVLPIAKKFGDNSFGNDWTYLQDGATSHTNKLSQEWCLSNLPNFIPKDKWPPNSPDLNPLDYFIWNEIVQVIQWSQVTSKDSLIKQIKRAVKQIKQSLILDICSKWYKRIRSLQSNNYKFIE